MRNLLLAVCAHYSLACLATAQINFPGSGNQRPSSGSTGSRGSSSSSGRGSSSGNLEDGRGSGASCCQASSACASTLISSSEQARNTCKLPNGSFGVCCSQRRTSSSSRAPFQPADFLQLRNTQSLFGVTGAVRRGEAAVRNLTSQASRYAPPSRNSGAFYHAKFQRQARRETKRQGDYGLLLTKVAKELAGNTVSTRKIGRSPDSVNFGPNVEVKQALDNDIQCPSQEFCSDSIYRTADGSCNNFRETNWGKSDTVLSRILLPEYADGVESPRIASRGQNLPSARLLSTALAKNGDPTDSRFSVILMSFGQFIDHDLTHSPILSSRGGGDIDCCSSSSSLEFDSFCHPIRIPFNDNFFNGRKSCMNLVRSTPGPALDCSARYREQINQLTHWLDLSTVYGSNNQEQRSLRANRGGRLITGPGPDGPILPRDTEDTTCKAGACMRAGDGRVNEQPNLGLLHIIFMREHNRIANELSSVNRNWSDEQLFQEARKILIAKYQHILYNEWLPIVLGKQYMNLFGLTPLSRDYSRDYDPSIDPRITNEFATAAFRFGHTLIPGLIRVNNRIGREINPSFSLRDSFFKPELLRLSGMVDGLVSGLTRETVPRFDTSFTEDVTNHLFDGDENGMDLVALNIQRGREHGLPGYTKYKELCSLGTTNSFSDLSRHMSVRRTEELQQIYDTPDDIDLFAGLFSERAQPGALVGPTTLCLVGDQFARLKKGDRFFHDLGGQSGSFSSQQLKEIRKASLSRLLCDNSGVSNLQPLSFQIPSNSNPILSCQDEFAIPVPSLQPWFERSVRSSG